MLQFFAGLTDRTQKMRMREWKKYIIFQGIIGHFFCASRCDNSLILLIDIDSNNQLTCDFIGNVFKVFLITKNWNYFEKLLISFKLTMKTNKPWFNMNLCLWSLTHTQSSASFLRTENLIVSHLVFCSLPALIYLQHSILPFSNWKK